MVFSLMGDCFPFSPLLVTLLVPSLVTLSVSIASLTIITRWKVAISVMTSSAAVGHLLISTVIHMHTSACTLSRVFDVIRLGVPGNHSVVPVVLVQVIFSSVIMSFGRLRSSASFFAHMTQFNFTQ